MTPTMWLTTLVVCVALIFTLQPVEADNSLSFLVVGDWGADIKAKADVKTQHAVAASMAKIAKQAGSDHTPVQFVVNVGDNVYDNGISSPDDPLWKQTVIDPYNLDGLKGIKWLSALGNHDYNGMVDAQLSTQAARQKDSPHWHMPARYYSYSATVAPGVNADFFVLDTNPWIKDYIKNPESKIMGQEIAKQDVKKQQAWFASAWNASKAKWKFVIGHHGAYTSSDNHCYDEVSDFVQPFMADAQSKGVGVAYFSGHYHTQEHNIKKDLHFYTSGAGARLADDVTNKQAKKPYKDAPHRTEFGHRAPGFMQCTLTATVLECNFLDIDGKNLHQVHQTIGGAAPPAATQAAPAKDGKGKSAPAPTKSAAGGGKDDGKKKDDKKKDKKNKFRARLLGPNFDF